MSFGDDSGPIGGLVTGAVRQFDQVLGPAFDKINPPKSAVNKPAMTEAPSAPTAAPSADTPGRHKSLLGQ